ncbi:hypothetical protein, partial [Aliivibrio kagoshimensis]|uniref:hypothetical protein n=1 Tax=Aliivibrio kagoshimensis TaxID=2910230 RepID=UPI003D0EAD41
LLGDINNPTLSVKSNEINSVNNPIKLLKTAEEWHSETIHLHVKEEGTILDLDIKIGSETYLAKFIIKPVH